MRFLGIDIDSEFMELRLPLSKLEKLIIQLNLYIKRWKATRLELEGLGGGPGPLLQGRTRGQDLLEASL